MNAWPKTQGQVLVDFDAQWKVPLLGFIADMLKSSILKIHGIYLVREHEKDLCSDRKNETSNRFQEC